MTAAELWSRVTVDEIGGSLAVTSVEGRGSTVTIELSAMRPKSA